MIRPEGMWSRAQAWAIYGACLIVFLALGFYGAGLYADRLSLVDLEGQARDDANLKVALLRAVLERPRSLPLLLSEDQQVLDALTERTPQAVQRLNEKLERLVTGTSASVLYVTDVSGRAIASSNWREPLSFVGVDYSFRDYFSKAMAFGTAEHFALGSISKRPGLYISRRVGAEQGALGVVVVKTEFDQLETDWREATRSAFVTDANGVVLISSIPSWRFMTLSRLAPEQLASIRESLQFGDAPLRPLPINHVEPAGDEVFLVRSVFPGDIPAQYLHLAVPVPSTVWSLNYLVPTEPTLGSAEREMRLITLAVQVPVAAFFALLLWRRQASLARMAKARSDRLELERRVEERTRDLSQARDRLEAEMTGHRATEARLQVVQQELVQANRLAILGQVAAGVAHEINQPLATIRAYAENAQVFLQRQQTAPVSENLGAIARLTERIGTITDELKAFARKGRTAPEPVLLREVIEGAVVLLRSRFAGRLEALVIHQPPADLAVRGNRIRLEQVLINLFQNALEALENRSDARVEVSAAVSGSEVVISVRDNGPGIAEEIRPHLFAPFNTSKDKGLGLGLVISKDIIGDYGGRLEVESDTLGTCFTIHLPKAEP
ncbi:sensor histidine kinase [Rhizobium paknamense]|uniref:C4-dicarboxylate transport sensor protein n=1 Tax=Rhizobium paknamense TaxID=1206817 RepID=A0ABU0IDX4_9HYPH|nr:ATP-binding protein [Rhizobium paknamense]MDQ0456430.1 two-component system C4-dicarboxylate transport sensor histidine kinase DctB [Rhizobium paknamense]